MKEDVVMHKNSPSLHIVSGFIAFFIYAIMLFLLICGFRFHKEQDRHGEENSVIAEILADKSIELDSVVPQQEDNTKQEIQSQNTNKTEKNITQTPEKEIIESPKVAQTIPKQTHATETPKDVKEAPKEVNLADVFANVSSKTSQDIRKEEEAKRKQELEEIYKKQDEEQRAKQAQLTKNALALEQSTKALQKATQNLNSNIKQAMTTKIVLEKPNFSGNAEDKKKYDAWYAKIEQILMSEWQKSGSFDLAATRAKVKIHIDEGGRLTYLYMITQSPYGDYNNSVIAFLKKMGTKTFPPPPGDGVDMSMELENTLRH